VARDRSAYRRGSRLFHLASAKTYMRVAYAIITLAGVVGMPLFDRWLR
jgi:hypothetical protein